MLKNMLSIKGNLSEKRLARKSLSTNIYSFDYYSGAYNCVGIEMRISVQARQQGKSEAGLKLVGMFIEQNKELYLGSNDVDGLVDRIKEMYPEAKLSKHKGYVVINEKS